MNKPMFVYLLTNANKTVLYCGVTNDLVRRMLEHREKRADGFTARYNVCLLLWYEQHEDPESAIRREKQIKAGSRADKERLIEEKNPGWVDLSERIFLNAGLL